MSIVEELNQPPMATTRSDVVLGRAFTTQESAAIRGDFAILSRFRWKSGRSMTVTQETAPTDPGLKPTPDSAAAVAPASTWRRRASTIREGAAS